jgi:hypothetical protein
MSKKEPVKQFLDSEEMHKIEIGSLKQEILNNEFMILEQRRDANELHIRIYQHKKTIESFRLLEARERINENAKSQKKFTDKLKTKYGIKEGFGYDPRTGEVTGASTTTIKE